MELEDIKNKSIGQLYSETKLSPEVMEDILKIGDASFEKLMKDKFNIPTESNEKLLEVYRCIIDVLRDYCDLSDRYYSLIAVWIIGTYFHDDFPTFPYLFLNAMKGSGKSRTMRLITYLSSEGSMLNAVTEAVLFRTKGTLGIDEFEGITKKGKEALLELLNSAYKQGVKVKRMKKAKGMEEAEDGTKNMVEKQVVEEFDVYRPIIMCNISGMDEVLADRCIPIILDKSNKSKITKKMEIFDIDTRIQKIKSFPFIECRKCRVDALKNIYMGWNAYVNNHIDTYDTTTTTNTNDTNDTTNDYLYSKINETGIDGRNLELTLPLLIVSKWISNDLFSDLLVMLKGLTEEKRKEDFIESLDVSLIDFVSQTEEGKWIILKDLLVQLKGFIQMDEEWFNERWLSRALKRTGLIKDKKRMNYGRTVLLDVPKALEKIKMFKE